MSQTFRKYINNRGSALFMVLSTMTALFLLVTAMYFSVISSRSVQYAVFNQEQAYQSSISISDALVAALTSGNAPQLSTEILGLAKPGDGQKTGGSFSTKGNGFAEFLGEASGASYSDDQLGAYTVEITRLNDATENGTVYQVFDFAITSSVGGVLETTHTFVRYSGVFTSAPDIFGTGMTSTGYVPNSPRLDRGTYDTPLRYDSEYTVINDGALGESASYVVINDDLTCTGTLRIIGVGPNSSGGIRPMTWVIGNDLELDTDNKDSFCSFTLEMKGTSSERGKVIVGGDLISTRVLYIPAYTDVYVKGDVYVETAVQLDDNAGLYVDGNVYVTDLSSGSNNVWKTKTSNFQLPAGCNVYEKTKYEDTYSTGLIAKANGNIGVLDTDSQAWKDAWATWDGKMTSPTYEKWTVITDADNPDKVTLWYNCSWKELSLGTKTIPKQTFVNYELDIAKHPNGVILEDLIDLFDYYKRHPDMGDGGAATGNIFGIVIDTGEDPDAVFKIQLKPNQDYDMDGKNETFTWLPVKSAKGDATFKPYVLVKGRGTLAIEVPNGTTYQASHQEVFMHMNWYTMLGGQITYADNGNALLGGLASGSTLGINAYRDGWIHNTKGCSGSVKCKIVDKTEKNDEGKNITIKYCETHERKVTVSEIAHECGCYGVVEKSVIDSWMNSNLSSKSAEQQAAFRDSKGDTIYPNVNTMLISSDESAQIRLSFFDDGTCVGDNTYWGWIYAPYMTYMAKPKGDGSGGSRIVGGIIVSDYISDDYFSFSYCRPDEGVSDALGDNLESTGTVTGFTWKAYGY
ncbi:MAG: hypothetical protein ACI4KM_04155 [Oscillospiraceae bacterium]